MLRVETIVCGPLDVNAYVVSMEGAEECFVVDPAAASEVLQYLARENLRCTHILLTHGHFDHIGGVADIKKETGATICMHAADADMLTSDARSMAVLANVRLKPVSADCVFTEDETFLAAGIKVRALHTPGHTQGCVCYICEDENILFSGDTLFRLSVGRADFPDSNEELLYTSLVEKLFALQHNYTVYPGHMRSTMLDFEREHNPFLRAVRGQQW
ncbi:MBL fold metallo-hydrolase [Christensenellaceae bacterium OttesenSCG-928-L17]|nr:MBL fold metallo-hydrolase [Christensenellaceae bacterium OttesenSCG-928-L17]